MWSICNWTNAYSLFIKKKTGFLWSIKRTLHNKIGVHESFITHRENNVFECKAFTFLILVPIIIPIVLRFECF